MKKFLLLLSLMLGLSCSAEAQSLRNASNSYIGKVERDGTIRNASNSCIGKAEGVDRKTAAVLIFMDVLK